MRRSKSLFFAFVILCSFSTFARPYTEEEKEGINLYKIGLEFLKKKQFEEAIQYFDKSTIKAPKLADAYLMKGRTLNKLGQYENAIKEFDTVLKIHYKRSNELKNSIALANKALSLFVLKKYKESIDCSNKSLSYDDQFSMAYRMRANSYGASGQYQLAITDYDKAIELDPSNPTNDETYLNRFCPLYKLGRYEEALATCNKALDITDNPNTLPQIYSKKAMALNKLGRYEEALENANKALEVNAKDPLALSEKNLAKSKLKKDSWF